MHEEALAACTEAGKIAQQLVSEFPDVPDYQNALAEAHEGRAYGHFKLGDLDRAIADLDEAIRFDPDDAALYANRGILYSSKGDFEQAMTNADKAIRLDPEHAPAYDVQANVFFRRRKFEQAIAAYGRAIGIDPNSYLLSPLLYYNRGTALAKMRQFDQAVADYDAALRLRPDFYSALHNRAAAHARTGDIEKAIEDYTAALRVDPTASRGFHARGCIYLTRRQFARAVDDFNKALQHWSKGDSPIDNLVTGQLYSDVAWLLATCPDAGLRDADRAVALASEAVKLSPFGTTLTLGVARYRAGDWKEAIEALKESQGDACGLCFLAMAHWKEGHIEEAHGYYYSALDWIEKNKSKQKAFRRFCVEAAEVLGLEPPPATEPGAAEEKPEVFTDHMIFAWSAWQDPIL